MASDYSPGIDDARRRDWVKERLSRNGGDPSKLQYTDYGRAPAAITKAALEHAEAHWPKSDLSRLEPGDLFMPGASVIGGLADAIRHPTDDPAGYSSNLWSHRANPVAEIKKQTAPLMGRGEIETIVQEYLDLPYRSQHVDRLLVDLLVALEVYAYGETVIKRRGVPDFIATPILKRRPIWEWFLGNLFMVVLWTVLGTGFWGLSRVLPIPDGWVIGFNVVLGLLFALNLIWSTLWLPRTWWIIHRAKRKASELLEEMLSVYAELQSDGPISVRHIELRARSAANAGVVWPPPLFVLLEDICTRGGRI